MKATTVRTLLVWAGVAALVGFLLAWIINMTGRLIGVPAFTGVTVGAMALVLGLWGLRCRPRLQRKDGVEPMDPLVAARTAALALAASRTGAAFMGLYLGIALFLLTRIHLAAARPRLFEALGVALASVALAVVAVWLERMCQLPKDPDGDQGIGGRPAGG